jgi:hypothetical protein
MGLHRRKISGTIGNDFARKKMSALLGCEFLKVAVVGDGALQQRRQRHLFIDG